MKIPFEFRQEIPILREENSLSEVICYSGNDLESMYTSDMIILI